MTSLSVRARFVFTVCGLTALAHGCATWAEADDRWRQFSQYAISDFASVEPDSIDGRAIRHRAFASRDEPSSALPEEFGVPVTAAARDEHEYKDGGKEPARACVSHS
jgi:hypothetical protein